MRRVTTRLAVLMTPFVSLIAVAAAPAPAPAAGEAVYTRWCVHCHSSGRGNPGTDSLQVKYGGKVPAVLVERTDLSPEAVSPLRAPGCAVDAAVPQDRSHGRGACGVVGLRLAEVPEAALEPDVDIHAPPGRLDKTIGAFDGARFCGESLVYFDDRGIHAKSPQ